MQLCYFQTLIDIYIEVRASSPGQGTYYLRYKDANGKTCHQKTSRTTELSLSEARKQAKTLKAEIALGADPRGEEKAKKRYAHLSTKALQEAANSASQMIQGAIRSVG